MYVFSRCSYIFTYRYFYMYVFSRCSYIFPSLQYYYFIKTMRTQIFFTCMYFKVLVYIHMSVDFFSVSDFRPNHIMRYLFKHCCYLYAWIKNCLLFSMSPCYLFLAKDIGLYSAARGATYTHASAGVLKISLVAIIIN